jgi:hypothetical protein
MTAEQNDYDDMPGLSNDMPPLIPIRSNTGRNTISNYYYIPGLNNLRNAMRNADHLSIPPLNINNLPPLLNNPIPTISQHISPLPGDYQINFDTWYDERTGFEIQPYLTYIGQNDNQSIVRLNQNINWDLFEKVARIRERVVFIKINGGNENPEFSQENNANSRNELPEYKTIICPEILINNYAMNRDQYIMINGRPVYCASDSELYRGCEWAIEHTQPFHYNE